MALGPYLHMAQVGIDGDLSQMPSWAPYHLLMRIREWARVAWRREQLRVAYNTWTGDVEFYRYWKNYPFIYAHRPLNRGDTPGEERAIEQILRTIRKNKRPWKSREREVEQSKKMERDMLMADVAAEQATRRSDMVAFFNRQNDRRGMGRHYRPSAVIDRKPPALSA